MIKLIVSDVDGTLLPEGTADLDPEYFDVIRALKAKGITFAAASGRQVNSIEKLFAPVLDEVYLISNNGGYVSYQGKELQCRSFSGEMVKEIVEYLRGQEDYFYLITDVNGDYTDCDDPEMIEWLRDGYKIEIRQVPDVLKVDSRFIKLSGYAKKQDAAAAAEPAKKRFGGRAMATAAGAHWIDFTAPGGEKGNALKELQDMLGVTPEETMAFGDNHNDIGMLLRAAESYGVSGAREEVKKICSHILPEGETVLNIMKTLV